MPQSAFVLPVTQINDFVASDEPSPLTNGRWWTFTGATAADDYWAARGTDIAIEYNITAGSLTDMQALTCDMLLDGIENVSFVLRLWEDGNDKHFEYTWSLLGDCQARMILPVEALTMNRWDFPRQGAFLKPLCGGDVVRAERVTRLRLSVRRMNPGTRRICLTPLTAVWS